jgi:hypothetical protein
MFVKQTYTYPWLEFQEKLVPKTWEAVIPQSMVLPWTEQPFAQLEQTSLVQP